MLTMTGCAILGKRIIIGATAWIWDPPPLVGNAATLVVRGNFSMSINITLSEIRNEFSAVVRKQ